MKKTLLDVFFTDQTYVIRNKNGTKPNGTQTHVRFEFQKHSMTI